MPEQPHPFHNFRVQYQISDAQNADLTALLGHLGQTAADSNPMDPEQVAIEIYSIFPQHRGNISFCEELLAAWEPHQFDILRAFLRSHGWKC